MKKIAVAAVAASCTLVAPKLCEGAKFACPHWLSVMPLHENYAEQLAEQQLEARGEQERLGKKENVRICKSPNDFIITDKLGIDHIEHKAVE